MISDTDNMNGPSSRQATWRGRRFGMALKQYFSILGLLLGVCMTGPSVAASQGAGDFYVPPTISPAAQTVLARLKSPRLMPAWPAATDIAGWDALNSQRENMLEENAKRIVARYGSAHVGARRINHVPVLDIRPGSWKKGDPRLLIYLHGGGYVFGSSHSTIPISLPMAEETGIRTIAIDYTLAPHARYKAVLEEDLAVIRGLLAEGYSLKNMAFYGESAGGSMAAGLVLEMRDAGVGMPAAVLMISPWSDITDSGDSYHTLASAEPAFLYDRHLKSAAAAYAPLAEQKNPYVSPVYGDYSKGFPPTLIQGGTKEIFLSNFVRQYQAIDQAGIPVKLDLYEGMIHVFQVSHPDWLETKVARLKIKAFLDQYLPRPR
jgi:monoterpene epsilon-lactone hydrolase